MQQADLFLEMRQRSSVTADQVTVRNILLATDFSECSARALDYALEIAHRYESQLYLFHCVDPTPYNLLEPGAVQSGCDDVRRELEQLVSDLRHQGRARNLDVKVVVEAGDLTVILPQAVKDLNLDLIVVGTRGRTGWRKLVLGSVAEIVVDQVFCPVLSAGPSADPKRIREFRPENILFARETSVSSLRNRMPFRLRANMALGSQ